MKILMFLLFPCWGYFGLKQLLLLFTELKSIVLFLFLLTTFPNTLQKSLQGFLQICTKNSNMIQFLSFTHKPINGQRLWLEKMELIQDSTEATKLHCPSQKSINLHYTELHFREEYIIALYLISPVSLKCTALHYIFLYQLWHCTV